MARRQYDERGLPIPSSSKPSGNLTVRLDDAAWAVVGELRAFWSLERKMNLSITDTIRAAIFHARDVARAKQEEGGFDDNPALPEPCLACPGVEDGDAYKCLGCGRGLADSREANVLAAYGQAEATEAQKARAKATASKPAPVKKTRAKKG